MTVAYKLPGHTQFPEPALRFGGASDRNTDLHPLLGLSRFGPYSRDRLSGVANPIRIAMIAPAGGVDRLNRLMQELEQPHRPKERKAYLPDYPGFSKLFGVSLAKAVGPTALELPADLQKQMAASPRPHQVLADAITRALYALRNVRMEFDIVLIHVDRSWSDGFRTSDGEDFDLRHHLKAIAASEGICIQIVRDEGALGYYCRCSVAWRLGVALYTKAGGTPWVLADVEPGTAFIGIDYAMRSDAGPASRYAICCSQVFDAEGSGMEFVAYEASDVRMFGKNPFLRRDQMLKVISRSLLIYQRKHAGQSPRRIVVHKNTEFKPEEVEGCFDALPRTDAIDLVHVQQSSGWRGMHIPEPRKPHGYPVHRGTALQLGAYETLLWTQGNLPVVANDRDYFKEGKGIPEPLMLVRYAGNGSMDDLCRQTLGLTKMDWNNDGPYDRLPVTLNFAQTLAKVVVRMPTLEPRSYPFRLFM